MKILFITSCLEPGRDGVGDYLYRLADFLMRLGHDVCLFSLRDPFVEEVIENESKGPMGSLKIIRCPKSEFEIAIKPLAYRALVDQFEPDWISFQLVPYAWNEKGVVRGLKRYVKFLTKTYALHIFCHELWIGASCDYDLKKRFLGRLQRVYIRGFLKSLKPKVVHTSNLVYRDLLRRSKVPASILPLAGTISSSRPHDFSVLYALLKSHGLSLTETNHQQYFIAVHFGTLHEEWTPEALFSSINQHCEQSSKKGIILSLGSKTDSARDYFKSFSKANYSELSFYDLGRQPEDLLASLFAYSALGLSSTPWALRDKSSAVMCMREQGLPIVFTRDDWRLIRGETPLPEEEAGIYLFNDRFKSDLSNGLKTPSVFCSPSCVAMQFIQSLVSAASK